MVFSMTRSISQKTSSKLIDNICETHKIISLYRMWCDCWFSHDETLHSNSSCRAQNSKPTREKSLFILTINHDQSRSYAQRILLDLRIVQSMKPERL